MRNNLHRIMGAHFQHVKQPCETCAHREPYGEWEGFCALRKKVLSWAEPERQSRRCPDALMIPDSSSHSPDP